MRFSFPSAFAGRAALSEAASLRTIPLRRSTRSRGAAGGGRPRSSPRPCGFSALRLPCVAPTPRLFDLAVHAGSMRVIRRGLSCTRRSATRDIEPSHDWAGPALPWFRSGNARGICFALRSVPCLRVPAFVTTPCDLSWCCPGCLRRSSPLAVIDLVPRAADFYGCRSRANPKLLPNKPNELFDFQCDAIDCGTIRPASGSYAAGKPNQRGSA
jgi:hypothetical protein